MSARALRDFCKRRLALLVLALIAMPVMAVAFPWAWTLAASFPDVRLTSEQIDMLLWLPVTTLYAAAAVVMAAGFNINFTYEPGRETEIAWHNAALAGDPHARWMLVRHDLRWFVLLAMSGTFFWMAR